MFNHLEVLPRALYEQISYLKAFEPGRIEKAAAKRLPPSKMPQQLVLAAADHNARMITAYRDDPVGLSDRHVYLARLIRMLQSPEVNGVEATADIIEDLLLADALLAEAGAAAFLSDKLLIGTVNRGGLKGAAWEMDDFCGCYTVERIAALGLDGVKFMLRINPEDVSSRQTLQYCAETINRAHSCHLPVFIEVLQIKTEATGFSVRTDLVSLCQSLGVTAALGCTTAQKWLEVPLGPDYARALAATTCPILVVPDEAEHEPLPIVREYTKEKGLAANVRGILLGRNVMYYDGDPYPLAHAIGKVWHSQLTAEEAYEQTQK